VKKITLTGIKDCTARGIELCAGFLYCLPVRLNNLM
jgi:hypothetical protein